MPLFIQLFGSAIALAAFIAAQAGWISATSAPYLTLNIIGARSPHSACTAASYAARRRMAGGTSSAALVTRATAESQWGFVILESVWARLARDYRQGCSRPPCREIAC